MWPSHHTQGVVSDTVICLPSPFWPCRTCRPPTEPHFAILPVAPAASYRRRVGPTRSAVHRLGTRWPGTTAGPLPARPLLRRSRRGDPGRTPSLRVRHFQGLPIFGLLDSAGGLSSAQISLVQDILAPTDSLGCSVRRGFPGSIGVAKGQSAPAPQRRHGTCASRERGGRSRHSRRRAI